MPILPRLAGLWTTVFRRRRLEGDLDAELDAAAALLVDRYVAVGMEPGSARP